VSFSAEAILAQLDACAQKFEFPMLDNGYVYLADVRLHLYRDDRRWAMVIEVLGANARATSHSGIDNCLHLFGNCLSVEPGTCDEGFLFPMSDGDDGPTFDDRQTVRRDAKTFRIRGEVVEIPARSVLRSSSGELVWRGTALKLHQFLRALVPDFRDRLLATEDELRRFVPADLPKIMRLDEWEHPDLCENEQPSESETFQMLAEVLETGDVARYRPTLESNTHWRNWPQGGIL
jgi:hypothetical protein